jgi:hypothetical protein
MHHRFMFAVFACFLSMAPSAFAQGPFTIKLREETDGDVVLHTRNKTEMNKTTISDGAGKVLKKDDTKNAEVQEFKETTLKRETGKPPVKLEREYIKMQDKGKTSPLEGKTIIAEKVGAKYTFTDKKGQAVAGAVKDALTKEFSDKSESGKFERMVLPKAPVKVGDTWKLELAEILKEFGTKGDMEFDTAKATGKGTLTKAYKKDGKQFGVMSMKIDAPLKSMGKGQLKFAENEGKLSLDLSMDVCIDGTASEGTMTMKMALTGTATLEQLPGARAVFDLLIDGTETQKQLPRK